MIEPGEIPLILVIVLGSLTTLCVAFVVWAVANESRALRIMEGAVGEQNTARVLRCLELRGWQVRNDVLFDGANLDHVAVGPGGVFAIETKSTSAAWDFTARRLDPFADAALRQARAAARKIRLLLSAVGALDVKPVLVCWGANVVDLPNGWVVYDDVVAEAARVWSSAVPWAAADAARRAEASLAEVAPDLLHGYRRSLATGADPADAMHASRPPPWPPRVTNGPPPRWPPPPPTTRRPGPTSTGSERSRTPGTSRPRSRSPPRGPHAQPPVIDDLCWGHGDGLLVFSERNHRVHHRPLHEVDTQPQPPDRKP